MTAYTPEGMLAVNLRHTVYRPQILIEWNEAQGSDKASAETLARLIAQAPAMAALLRSFIADAPATPANYFAVGAAAFSKEALYLIDAQNNARAILKEIDG